MKKILSIFALLLTIVTGAKAAGDVTLFTADFTDSKYDVTYPTDQYGSVTVEETDGTLVRFQGAKSGTAVSWSQTNGITFTGNNINASAGDLTSSNPNYYVEIPLTGVNGAITVTTTGDATKWYYTYSYVDGDKTKVLARQQASANNGFTIEGLNDSNMKLFIGSSGKKIKTITITTPAPAVVDPEFSLSATSIGTNETAQIKVAGKDDLDGITLSNIAYGTSGVVTVSSAGVVTPVATGTTTITFSSAAVDGKYNAGSGNLSITVTAPVVDTPTITAGGYFFDDSKTVEIACTDADATIKYSYDNSTWNDYTAALTITETTTVYAKAVKTGCEDSEVASATYTKFAPSEIAEVSTATTWDWTSWDQELQLTGESTPTSTDNYTYADIAVLSGTIAVPASFAGDKIMFKGQYPVRKKKSQAGTWTIKPSVAGTIKVTFSDTGSSIPAGGAAKRYLNINGVNTEYYTQRDGSSADKKTTDEIVVPAGDVVITAYGEDGETWQAIVVEKIVFTPFAAQDITVEATGFATIGLPFATTVPEGVTAYAVESVAGSKAKMSAAIEAGTTIPANKGFVIVAAPNTYSFAPVASSSYEGTDLLEATGINTKAATTDAPIYVLTVTDATNKKIGFKKATSGSLGAYKAYLPGTVATGNTLTMDFDDATAINGVAEAKAEVAPVKVIKNGQLFIGNYTVAGARVK